MKKIKLFAALFFTAFICLMGIGQENPLFYAKGEDLRKKTEKFLFIKISIDKREAYEGEQIVANYHLYVAVDIQGKLSKAPSFSGFASYDLQTGNIDNYNVEIINGTTFRVYLIKSIQLYGLSAGMQRLEPIELDATIRYKKRPDETFDEKTGFRSSRDTLISYQLKSKPVEIKVLALPETADSTFTGGVGSFKLEAFLAKKTIGSTQADTLHVVLSGKGNWHAVSLPTPQWPTSFEVYEPKILEELNPNETPVAGSKILSYPFVATVNGNYNIPPFSFTYFDPVLKRYQTTTTDTLWVEVRKDETGTLPTKPQNARRDYTKVFTGIAIALFPITAIILIILLVYRKKSNQNES